jgi:hypothetical protein
MLGVITGSPAKRLRADRLDFFRELNAPRAQIDCAIQACSGLTDEQLEVIKQARTPQAIRDDPNGGRIMLILAAAASGKTTTMMALVKALCAYGHGTKASEYTLYAFFNKNAVEDADAKLKNHLVFV